MQIQRISKTGMELKSSLPYVCLKSPFSLHSVSSTEYASISLDSRLTFLLELWYIFNSVISNEFSFWKDLIRKDHRLKELIKFVWIGIKFACFFFISFQIYWLLHWLFVVDVLFIIQIVNLSHIVIGLCPSVVFWFVFFLDRLCCFIHYYKAKPTHCIFLLILSHQYGDG